MGLRVGLNNFNGRNYAFFYLAVEKYWVFFVVDK